MFVFPKEGLCRLLLVMVLLYMQLLLPHFGHFLQPDDG